MNGKSPTEIFAGMRMGLRKHATAVLQRYNRCISKTG
jgi:hypothetical protein